MSVRFALAALIVVAAVAQAAPLPPGPSASFSWAPVPAAQMPVTFTSHAESGVPILDRTWRFSDTGSDPLARSASTEHAFARRGEYVVEHVVVDALARTAAETRVVVVPNTPPLAAIAILAPYHRDTPIRFIDVSRDVDGDEIASSWSWSDGAHATGRKVSRTYTELGTYAVTLTATDEAGGASVVSRSFEVVNAPPRLAPIASDHAPAPHEVVRFDAGAVDPDGEGPVFVAWSFGDGESATGAVVHHAFARAGTYEVVVHATDAEGGKAEASLEIVVG